MTPDVLAEIAKMAGLPAAILIYMWVNRSPSPKEKTEDPAAKILARLDAIEDRQIATHSLLEILMDRTPRK